MKKSPFRAATAALVLVVAVTVTAISGALALVTAGDDGAASGRAAQQPLGTLSATPPAQPETQAEGIVETRGDQGAGGEGAPGGEDAPAATPGDVRSVSPSGSGGDSSLPFTGFLAIPVLLVGAGLLLTGVALRRRSGASAAPAS